MSEKNKKIKFNGMDAFICIVIILVAAVGAYFLKGMIGGGSAVAENTNVTMTVELTGQTENIKDAIKVGDVVSVGEKDKVNLTVSKVEATPAKTLAYDIQDGTVYNSDIPEQYDIKISMTALGTETDSTIMVDNSALRIGKAEILSAKGWAGYGYTIDVTTSSAAE